MTTEIKLPTTVRSLEPPKYTPPQRSEIRRTGFFQILAELNRDFFFLPRQERRKLAKELQKKAWDQRDPEAVKKLMTGKLADAKYWKDAQPHLE